MTRASPSLAVEDVAIDALHPDPGNPRRIADAELEALTRSIQRFGLVEPILVRREGRRVIGGHQRLVAARRLGLTTVPVIFLDISAEWAGVLNLALNKISDTWDEELLARLVAELNETPDVDCSLTGFGDAEIARLLRSLDAREKRERPERFDRDAALEAVDTSRARTSPGDLWQLGAHRLLCGDATHADDVAKLLDGAKAAMAFTDPPYNVAYGDHGAQQRGARKRRLANDAMPAPEWDAFGAGWAATLTDAVDGPLYVCMSTKEWPGVSRRLAGGREAPLARDRDQSDVWTIPRSQESPLHPTMKPLALVERAIANSSRAGDRVLDLFLGSGTPLIACERTGRVGVGLEIDPRYVDITVQRWRAFTGEKAVKA